MRSGRRLAIILGPPVLAAALLVLLAPRPPGPRLLRTVVLPRGFLALSVALDPRTDQIVAQTWNEAGPLATLSGLAILDGRDGTLRQTVRMPQGAAARTLILDSVTGRAFVDRTGTLRRPTDLADTGRDLLSIYDPAGGALAATLALGRSPAAAVVGPRTGRLYLITNTLISTSQPVHIALTTLDGRTGRTLQSVQTATPPNAFAIGAAVDEQAGRMLVIAYSLPRGYFAPHPGRSGTALRTVAANRAVLYLLDLRGALIARLPLGALSLQTTALAVDPGRGRAVLVTSGRIRVIDSVRGRLIRSLALPGAQPDLALDRASGHAYVPVAAQGRGSAAILDGSTGALLGIVRLDPRMASPAAVALDARAHRLFVLDPRLADGQQSGLVAVLDDRRGLLLDTVAVGGEPYALSIDEAAGRALVFSRGYGRQTQPAGAHLVAAPVPWWAQPPGWLPWLQRQAAPPPDIADPTVSVLDAAR